MTLIFFLNDNLRQIVVLNMIAWETKYQINIHKYASLFFTLVSLLVLIQLHIGDHVNDIYALFINQLLNIYIHFP